LDENPVLEQREPGDEIEVEEMAAVVQAERDERHDPGAAELVIDESKGELDFDRLDALSRDYADAYNEEHRPSRNGLDEEMDRKHDAMQNMISRPQSLQDYLADQLGYQDLNPDDARLAKHVIAYIDDNGFLTVPDESDPEYQKLLANPDYKPKE